MSYARVFYAPSGTDYAVPFQYQDQSEVKVKIGGVASSSFSWVNSSTIRFSAIPSDTVLIYRDTAKTSNKAVYLDGVVDNATTRNLGEVQHLFSIQEAADVAADAVGLDEATGTTFTAKGKRITNVAAPVEDTDAVTLQYIEATLDLEAPLTVPARTVRGSLDADTAVVGNVELKDLKGQLYVPGYRSSLVVNDGLMSFAVPSVAAKLTNGTLQTIPSGTATQLLPSTVEFDTMAAMRGTTGRLYAPPDADLVEVTASVQWEISSAGTVRALQIFKNGEIVSQMGQAPNGAAFASYSQVSSIFQVNQPVLSPLIGFDYFEVYAFHDAGSDLDVLAASVEFTLKVLSRKPQVTNFQWLKTVQGGISSVGAEVRNWSHILANQFGGDYDAMVTRLASFSVLNMGSVIGWGDGTRFPHPRAFTGGYSPISPEFNLAGRGGQQFLADIKAANPMCKIFIYTTPLLDNIGDWNPLNGVPDPGTSWDQGGWANLINTLNANIEDGNDYVDGIYFDLIGDSFIDLGKLNEAVNIVKKSYQKNVMLNVMVASEAAVSFGLSCNYLGPGDYIFVEGFEFDSTNGSTSAASTTVAALMAKAGGSGIRFATVIEELDTETYASMLTGSANTHWTNGLTKFNTYTQPGWVIEHQRATYDYIGVAGNG